jgi:hypothetical protein
MTDIPPIVKRCEQLLRDVEDAVSRWPRRHRYALGDELRAQARAVTRWVHRAWRDRGRASRWVEELVWAIDEVKVSVQVGVMLKACSSFGQAEALLRLAADIGRQAQGWLKSLHSKDRNAATPNTGRQRQCVQTLSTCAASDGARS